MCQTVCNESLKRENGTPEIDNIGMAILELQVGVKAHRRLLLGDNFSTVTSETTASLWLFIKLCRDVWA